MTTNPPPDKDVELLPCPLCNGTDVHYNQIDNLLYGGVQCNECGLGISDNITGFDEWYDPKSKKQKMPSPSIKRWNTRLTPRKSVSEAMEALRILERDIECSNNAGCLPKIDGTHIETIRQAITSDPVAGWMPIDSAPKDGTEVLVFNTAEGDCGYCTEPLQIGIAYWGKSPSKQAWCSTVCCDGVSCFKPTHWQPLPKGPKDED